MQQFKMSEMQEMQKIMHDKYKNKWDSTCAQTGVKHLLWMIGEIGEVIDIIKKNPSDKLCEENDIRKHLVEEMVDVLMYYNDVMLCYGITADELKQSYVDKFEKNMKRW